MLTDVLFFSACTEAYNVTAQEKACHAGCGDQVGEKKKSGSERHVSAESRAAAPTPTAPSKTPSPSGIRYFWSKSIVDEQDVDSSSEERMRPPHSASQSSFPPGNDPFREVFNGIWPLRLLPPSFRITKSSVTYIGSESLNSQSATNRQAVAKQTAVPFLTSLMKGLTRKTSPQTQESGDTPGHGSEARPPKPEKGANYTVLSWKPGGTVGRPDIMLFFIGLSFFSAFFLLFRAIIATKNYLPISVSIAIHCYKQMRHLSHFLKLQTLDIKKDDAAGEHDTGEDDLDSDDESLFGMGSRLVLMSRRPPTYEQAQQDLNAKLNRPLLVSLDLPASNNTTC